MSDYNASRYDVLNSLQQKKVNVNYQLNYMFACLNIGLLRKKQEDAALLLEHPDNKGFKLIAVADGMGGLSNGGMASNLALINLINWFESLPPCYYYKENKILNELYDELKYIDFLIRKRCNDGGTTLALSIFTKDNNICINIGDSRIYLYKSKRLKQISTDHSLCWKFYEEGLISKKDDIRFHKDNHLITSRLGCNKKSLIIDKTVISTSDYEMVCLFSDGVTDCLSDEQIENIIKNNENENMAPIVIEKALTTTSRNNNLDSKEYYSLINGGKDNLSAAIYNKKIMRRRIR